VSCSACPRRAASATQPPCLHCGAVWLQRVAEGIQYRQPRPESAGAPMQERLGPGVGMSRRWADDDETSPLDLLKTA
jgi:hypothetical protein